MSELCQSCGRPTENRKNRYCLTCGRAVLRRLRQRGALEQAEQPQRPSGEERGRKSSLRFACATQEDDYGEESGPDSVCDDNSVSAGRAWKV